MEEKRNGVLLVIGKTWICKRIQAHTKHLGIAESNTASHVAYKFYYDPAIKAHPKMVHKATGKPLLAGEYVIESHINSGVAVFEYNYWLLMNKNSNVSFFEDEMYKLPLMLDLIGEKYGTKSILAIKLQTDKEFFNKNKLFYFFGLINNLFTKLIPSKDYPGIYCSELLLLADNYIPKIIGKKPYESWPSDLQKYYLDLGRLPEQIFPIP